MNLLRLAGRALKPYVWGLVVIVLMQCVVAFTALYLPTLNADIINDGVAVGNTDKIWSIGGLMLIVTLVNVVATVISNYIASRASMGAGRDMRRDVFHQVLDFSTKEVKDLTPASLITRNTNDVQQVQMLIFFTCNFLVQAPITGVGGIIMAIHEEAALAWLIVVLVPLMILVVSAIVAKASPIFRQIQKRIDTINLIFREQVTGVRVLRAFTRERYETERFEDANNRLNDLNYRVGLLVILMQPTTMILLNVSSVAVIYFGGRLIDAGSMEVGSLTAFIAYLMQILISVMMATFMLMMIPRAMVSADRITEVLRTSSSVVPPSHPAPVPTEVGELRFDGVSFSYPGAEAPVLEELNFTAHKGQTLAIIGGTGSGKTSLLNLIPRLADATDGHVLVDGTDVRDMSAEELWERVALVPQRPYLFSGTIASNLRFGDPDATDQDLWHALSIAQASDFVAAMPDGLDSPIAQGGTNVSGGQRQRLCIARALIAHPEIYMFDDSFSALDLTTDARLRAALAPETRDALVVMVAQRVSTITSADKILVLDHGRVVGEGTHAQLLETNETYQEIVRSQGAEEVSA